MKILVAVDGSQESLHAARKALELARLCNASVTLVHVEPPVQVYGDGGLGVSSEAIEVQRVAGEGLLADTMKVLEPSLPVPSRLSLQGPPAESIAEVAVRDHYDIVVVGNSGRSSVSKFVLGSVADRLVRICQTPLLIVR